jgi:hypothetical protein
MTRKHRGSALAITLILLAGLGTLALMAVAAAAAALALAGHQQSAQQAFESAEAGIAHALVLAARTRAAGEVEPTDPESDVEDARFHARIVAAELPGALPAGFSVGEHSAAFAAQHYFIIADGHAARGARVRIEQGFYLVVPGGDT